MKWYKKCFDSLKYSSIPVETIVIDNNSSDETISFIKDNYPEIYLIESKENLGFGKANNLGFEYALEKKADFIFLLNQDAWVKTNAIENLVNKMNMNPEYGILSPIHLCGDEKHLDHGFEYYITPIFCPNLISDFVVKGKTEDRIYPIKFVNAALWLISADCLNKVGGFDTIFPHYGEDVDYCNRCNYQEFKIGIYPHAFGVHDRIIKGRSGLALSKMRYNYKIDSLIVLKDIKEPFFLCIFRSIMPNISFALKKLLKLSFKDSLAYFAASLDILFLLPKAYKHRNISKKEGMKFFTHR